MPILVEAIDEAGVLQPLTPLRDIPEPTTVRLTVEVAPMPAASASVIDQQRQHHLVLDPASAQAIGDHHDVDRDESEVVVRAIPPGTCCSPCAHALMPGNVQPAEESTR